MTHPFAPTPEDIFPEKRHLFLQNKLLFNKKMKFLVVGIVKAAFSMGSRFNQCCVPYQHVKTPKRRSKIWLLTTRGAKIGVESREKEFSLCKLLYNTAHSSLWAKGVSLQLSSPINELRIYTATFNFTASSKSP